MSELEDYIINNNKELKKLKRDQKITWKKLMKKNQKWIFKDSRSWRNEPWGIMEHYIRPETRNLLQVQYKRFQKDQSLIHTLMGNDVALRKDFIVSNAINVRNLI